MATTSQIEKSVKKIITDFTSDSFIFDLLHAYETTVPHISPKDIRKYKIFLPPKPLQDKFATIVQQVEGAKTYYEESLDELNELFGSLSQRAFRGGVGVR
ncbi:MAG: hypothetical protein KAI79_03540 [Bacteroidales bacterium]|nr:hypothetical protein [Bacteroidales bacterium]